MKKKLENSFRVLIVEDNDSMRAGMTRTIEKSGCQVTSVASGKEAINTYQKSPHNFVITDLKLNDTDGIEVLRQIKSIDHEALVMVVTAFGTIDTAVKAMKLGAFDFITKPFSTDYLRIKLAKANEFVKMNAENRRLAQENLYLKTEQDIFPEILGQSESILEIYKKIKKVANIDSSVLITGESGTGKDLVARAIHYNSPRRQNQFIKVNCSALAEGLLESELFGHERGSFTGATARRLGRFEIADKGTIFLDEIGDISPAIQLKLLRVLQEKEFERVGGTSTISVDTRIVAATNQDLWQLVESGAFREDLYYRLYIIPIEMPNLRQRKEDIPLLVNAFLARLRKKISKQIEGVSTEALKVLLEYNWPGNIRELENTIEQAYVFCDSATIQLKDLPQNLKCGSHLSSRLLTLNGENLPNTLEEIEKQLISKAYLENNKIKTKTAKQLGIKTSALYYKLEKYEIN